MKAKAFASQPIVSRSILVSSIPRIPSVVSVEIALDRH
jgi:hypothetical protein